MGFTEQIKHLYEPEEPVPFLGTITICTECHSLVLPDMHMAHSEWHEKIDSKFSDIWERLNEGDL